MGGPSMTIDDIGEGTIPDEDYTLGDVTDALSGIKQTGQGIYFSPIQMAKRAKDAFDNMRAKEL